MQMSDNKLWHTALRRVQYIALFYNFKALEMGQKRQEILKRNAHMIERSANKTEMKIIRIAHEMAILHETAIRIIRILQMVKFV